MSAMPIMTDEVADAAAPVIDERFANPLPPLAERTKRRAAKPFVLTSKGLCQFIKDNTKTPDQTFIFLHQLGCTWDKNGKVTVHPI